MGVRRRALTDLPVPSQQAWAAARLWAAHHAPYLASAVLAMVPVVVDGEVDPAALRALPVDEGWRVYVAPALLERATAAEIGGWLVHQVCHLLREHAPRGRVATSDATASPLGGRSAGQRRWAVAVDCEVDDDLPRHVLPAEALQPAQLGLPEGRSAEEYLVALSASERAVALAVDCGSGSDGVARAWDARGAAIPDAEVRLLRRETARSVAAAGRTGALVPLGLQRWAQELLEPVVDWRQEFRATVRQATAAVRGQVDHTYRRRSRRAGAVPGVVLPGLHQPSPRVAVVLDTSGSMTTELLGQAVAEVGAVLRAVGVHGSSVRVICCDAAAHPAARVLDAREVRLLGGGETDLTAGLAAVEELRPRAQVVLVLTDGDTDWPALPPPHCVVVVGMLDGGGRRPAWGRIVDIPSPKG